MLLRFCSKSADVIGDQAESSNIPEFDVDHKQNAFETPDQIDIPEPV